MFLSYVLILLNFLLCVKCHMLTIQHALMKDIQSNLHIASEMADLLDKVQKATTKDISLAYYKYCQNQNIDTQPSIVSKEVLQHNINVIATKVTQIMAQFSDKTDKYAKEKRQYFCAESSKHVLSKPQFRPNSDEYCDPSNVDKPHPVDDNNKSPVDDNDKSLSKEFYNHTLSQKEINELRHEIEKKITIKTAETVKPVSNSTEVKESNERPTEKETTITKSVKPTSKSHKPSVTVKKHKITSITTPYNSLAHVIEFTTDPLSGRRFEKTKLRNKMRNSQIPGTATLKKRVVDEYGYDYKSLEIPIKTANKPSDLTKYQIKDKRSEAKKTTTPEPDPVNNNEDSGDGDGEENEDVGKKQTVKLTKANTDFYNDRKWPDNILRYVISDDPKYDLDDLRKRLKEVNKYLTKYTCVRMEEVDPRFTKRYNDYILLDTSPDYVTGRVGGQQRFGSIELFEGGQHKQHAAMMVMAMLGFYFEVSRHDRDDYIRVHSRHIRPEKLHHFERIRIDATFNLPYDYKSATHPAWQFWRKLGKTGISSVATYKINDPDGSIMNSLGQNDKLLSDIDIIKINSVYGTKCFRDFRRNYLMDI